MIEHKLEQGKIIYHKLFDMTFINVKILGKMNSR